MDHPSKILQDVPLVEDAFFADDKVYRLSDFEKLADTEVHTLIPESCYVVLRQRDHILDFALLEWHTEYEDETYCNLTLVGEGISQNLREMRHTWFAPLNGGYEYYLSMRNLIAACEFLKKYFDET